MAPLKLDSVDSLPSTLAARLLERRRAFEASPHLDDALTDPKVQSIAIDLEAYLRTQRLVGYHCTREPSLGYFKQYGLRALSLIDHHAWFWDTHGDQFTQEERERIEATWRKYFVGQQSR